MRWRTLLLSAAALVAAGFLGYAPASQGASPTQDGQQADQTKKSASNPRSTTTPIVAVALARRSAPAQAGCPYSSATPIPGSGRLNGHSGGGGQRNPENQ